MSYTPELPNKFDSDLIPTKIKAKYFDEYLGLTPLSVFMGTSPSDAIQVFEMKNGEGMSYRVPFRKDINYENPVIGYNQAIGSAQQVEIYNDEIKIELMRFVDGLMGNPLVKQMTAVDVFGALRPLLLNAQKRNLVKSILDTATVGLYTNPTKQGACKDRVVYCGATYADTITGGCSNMKGADYKKSGLSVAHIRQLKTMAITGGESFENEAKIKPIQITTKKGFPEEAFIYLMDTASFTSLSQDPEWSQQVHRGIIQSKDQPEGLSGSRYRGTIEGVMVYECPELARYRKEAEKVQASWNLFLGAQAFGLCWAKRPYFKIEKTDFELNTEMAVCEMRGQKALLFPSFQKSSKVIERGIIHSFVQYK